MMKESRIIGVMLMKASRVSEIYEPLYSTGCPKKTPKTIENDLLLTFECPSTC